MSPARRTRAAENRELIGTALDDTLIVEAAAGTGKTTELVARIVALIEHARATIDQIVAVTFSEKAAGELKLRLREELERARARTASQPTASRLLDAAVHDFEEAHISTIHTFCADLLRERPVEARVDPAFAVLTDTQADALFDEAFTSWLHEQLGNPQPGVRRSLRRPVKWRFDDDSEDGPIERLRAAARGLLEWRDCDAPWSRPAYDRKGSIRALTAQLKSFADLSAKPIKRDDKFAVSVAPARLTSHDLERQRRLVGDMVPEGTWDGWEAALIALAEHRDFASPRKGTGAAFAIGVTRDQALAAHGELLRALREFRDHADADLAALLHEEMRDCLRRYDERKQESGALDFLDLLIKARDLVCNNTEVCNEFRGRFRVILVDEFQDTDPLQADLLLRLAGDDQGTLRPGALFIVGDPKQSIYRFRRADIGAYQRIAADLGRHGAAAVTLQTSFRSVPAIQRFVNAAFRVEMSGDPGSLQADYVPLLAHRPDVPEQPAIVALPIAYPYGKSVYGPPQVTQAALNEAQPGAIGAFVAWMLSPECAWTVGEAGQRRKIVASDVCLLFRRFMHFGRDITRGYVEALESRGIPHLLVGGKTFHEREEVDAVRTALTAIEWPEDELSVYATLRGPLFAIGEEELLEYHSLARRVFHPYRIPADLPERLEPVRKALTALRELHGARNHRPVADTVGRLIAITRAHAGLILWRGGEQALANVLHISDLARRYELEGGLSFRGFVDMLHEASTRADSPEAPILEEGSDGVRLMTVHKAKGLEFPVVVLADIACKLSLETASRYLDPQRRMCAVRIGGWSPLDLQQHNDEEATRDEAEGVRLAYVAATRARDVLIVPAVGDGPYEKGWVRPLNRALYPPHQQWQAPETARGVPLFKGRQTIMADARADGQPVNDTIRPGTYTLTDPASAESYSVVWWDPLLLQASQGEARGVRREDLISNKANAADVAADRATYDQWRDRRAAVQASGSAASMVVATATQLSDGEEPPIRDVTLEDAGFGAIRPSGKRFGTLVHALLASLPLDASADDVHELATLHARLLGAEDDEREAAAGLASKLLTHPRIAEARAAEAAGRKVWREVPVSLRLNSSEPPQLVDGQVDLAYESPDGWVIVDFKTDIEIASAQDAYQKQVALYVEAVRRATGQAVTGVILKV